MLTRHHQLNNRDTPGRDVNSHAVRLIDLFLNRDRLIGCPFIRAEHRRAKQRQPHLDGCAAVDLRQTLLRFEDTVVIKERYDPAA